jgi:hypothetical protein
MNTLEFIKQHQEMQEEIVKYFKENKDEVLSVWHPDEAEDYFEELFEGSLDPNEWYIDDIDEEGVRFFAGPFDLDIFAVINKNNKIKIHGPYCNE